MRFFIRYLCSATIFLVTLHSCFFTDEQAMKKNIKRIREELRDYYPKGEIDAMVRMIFEQLLGYSAVDMVLRADNVLPDFITDKITDIITRLKAHEPIQYILDDAYFYGMHLHVDGSTLIPRPETEQLIDMIARRHTDADLKVLDVGTGSGCIAIALARTLKFPQVTAIDISENALKVAERNAKELKARVKFKKVDILHASAPSPSEFDIIVSNPPYITCSERNAMERNVLDYEPHTALFVPDDNPLLFYRAITAYSLTALKPGGHLYFEINTRFADMTAQMLTDAGMEEVKIELDYTGRKRFAIARKKTQ